ncbi:phosphatidylinositol-3-phosphatase ymr1 [Dipsacomyces acuminosporus]|nr:phosphatidylinositol-3-phosphatase ymr1 [Dipsacomyces acuminosporus]
MDLIRVSKVDNVRLMRNDELFIGTLHLTTHHIIFNSGQLELWIGYPMIHSAVLQRPPRLARRGDTAQQLQPISHNQRQQQVQQLFGPSPWDDSNSNSNSRSGRTGGAAISTSPYASEYDSARNSSAFTSAELKEWALEGSIDIRCHHFLFLTLRCERVRELYDIFATIKHLSSVPALDRLYAFYYQPHPEFRPEGWGWDIYDPKSEFERMGVASSDAGKFWRFTGINSDYKLCPTYPPVLVVPSKISDTTLTYAARYRSKCRLPVLCYLHPNKASMTRSSQPMVGLKQARSVQDEKLIEAILASSEPQGIPAKFDYERSNIIIDARPTTNAVVNRAVGAGSENMDHYKRCRKVYLGIDNIHVMRDALNKLVDAIQTNDGTDRGVVARIQNSKTNWLRHIENIMVGVKTIVEAIDSGKHVVVHCSDGWDRTAQLTSLAQLCLDPYYRTMKGFAVLIEKEWVSFGHQFTLRCDHMGHPARFKITKATSKRQSAKGDNTGQMSGVIAGDSTDTSEKESEDLGTDSASTGENSESGGGFDFLQSTSMFGRFASRAFKGVQSRISSAIQAASDNLDDLDDPDPFFEDYPDLQPNYVPPSDSDGNGNSHGSSHRQHGGGGFRLGRSKHDHESSPVFQQFLDCVYQLWVQHPTMFEFNEEFLLDLFYHLHSAQFGTFLGNNARERASADFRSRTKSIWSWIWQKLPAEDNIDRSSVYYNDLYRGGPGEQDTADRVIFPDTNFIQYWAALFSCHDPALKSLSRRAQDVDSQGSAANPAKNGPAPAAVPQAHSDVVTTSSEGVHDQVQPPTDKQVQTKKLVDPLTSTMSDLSFDNVWAS